MCVVLVIAILKLALNHIINQNCDYFLVKQSVQMVGTLTCSIKKHTMYDLLIDASIFKFIYQFIQINFTQ